MAQEFILAPNLGSIGFLASAAPGFPILLEQYVQGLYKNFTSDLYNQPIGLAIKDNIYQLNQQKQYNNDSTINQNKQTHISKDVSKNLYIEE